MILSRQGVRRMNERIKVFRKSLGLSQTTFGEMLDVSMSAVRKWESGENVPSDAVISLMQMRMNLNKDWLLTGNGDMTMKKSRDKEIESFLVNILASDLPYTRELISVLSQMSTLELENFDYFISRFADALVSFRAEAKEKD